MRDLANNLVVKQAIAPLTITDDTGFTGLIIDRDGFDSVMFAITLGTLADAGMTGTVTVQEGDDSGLSDAASVATADLTISANDFTFKVNLFQTDDNKTLKVGYVGTKRYLRVNVAVSGNAAPLPLAAVAILGHATQLPQSTQKV